MKSIEQDTSCDIDQMTDSDVSQSSSTLLPRRPKQSRHKALSGRAHYQRAHTAPHYRMAKVSSSSFSSSFTFSSEEESDRSSSSFHPDHHPSTGTYSCHISCRVSPDKPGYFEYLRPYSVYCSPLKRSRSVPKSFDESCSLQHPELSKGQKTYLWHTAAVYSMTNLKALQERRYKQLLQHQVDIGFHTQEECDRYLSYLLGTRKRQYIADPRVWREPPKIPVRQKTFRLHPPSKSQSPRDYRFFPQGYRESASDMGSDSRCSADKRGQSEEQLTDEYRKGQAGLPDDKEKASDDKDKKDCSQQEADDNYSASDEKSLSGSIQGMSLYYDPKRRTTVTRGHEETGRENADNKANQKSPISSHQNYFWGSH
ncbi:uncharacterized protein LOC110989622 [Acanthaster planci]|uniref:Uncharacterized protein LOC110989622 n=1 Tax=Acanthaster planci TaxID=133434 RepID=A0A8B7ZWN2_ACAPL|nr:uncharacterized protein LOC110989622 [Acanthaster planci]